ncbi:hypothetical protein [Thauera humireducens]|uniref:hypothetical protein n=1 Tax=Thauera humireducens TaxID=1134435 RepID=UPI00311D4466
MKLYDLQDLADLLGRSCQIRSNATCDAIPSRCRHGLKSRARGILRWREEDIRAWLSSGVRGGGAA